MQLRFNQLFPPLHPKRLFRHPAAVHLFRHPDGLLREGGRRLYTGKWQAFTHQTSYCQRHLPPELTSDIRTSVKSHNFGLSGKPVCFSKKIISKVKNFRALRSPTEKRVRMCVCGFKWRPAVTMITLLFCHPCCRLFSCTLDRHFILLCPLAIHPLKYITVWCVYVSGPVTMAKLGHSELNPRCPRWRRWVGKKVRDDDWPA